MCECVSVSLSVFVFVCLCVCVLDIDKVIIEYHDMVGVTQVVIIILLW